MRNTVQTVTAPVMRFWEARQAANGYVSYRGTSFGDRRSWAIFAAWKIVIRT